MIQSNRGVWKTQKLKSTDSQAVRGVTVDPPLTSAALPKTMDSGCKQRIAFAGEGLGREGKLETRRQKLEWEGEAYHEPSAGGWRGELDGGFDALAFEDGVDGVGWDVSEGFEGAVGPADFDFVHDGIGGQSEMEARIAGGNVAGAGFDFFDLRAGGGSDGDASADGSTIAFRSD